jgi:hypothetical protein
MPRIVTPPGGGVTCGGRLMNSRGGQAEGAEPSRTCSSGRQGPWRHGLEPREAAAGGGRARGRRRGEQGSISEKGSLCQVRPPPDRAAGVPARPHPVHAGYA